MHEQGKSWNPKGLVKKTSSLNSETEHKTTEVVFAKKFLEISSAHFFLKCYSAKNFVGYMVIREVENLKQINRKKSCANLESQTEGMDFLAIQTWRRLLTQDY